MMLGKQSHLARSQFLLPCGGGSSLLAARTEGRSLCFEDNSAARFLRTDGLPLGVVLVRCVDPEERVADHLQGLVWWGAQSGMRTVGGQIWLSFQLSTASMFPEDWPVPGDSVESHIWGRFLSARHYGGDIRCFSSHGSSSRKTS